MKLLLFIYNFFYWLGIQNDYNYPTDKNDIGWYPFKKKHFWKTRIGFKTSFNLAKFITFGK
jgi:hypothetical protein